MAERVLSTYKDVIKTLAKCSALPSLPARRQEDTAGDLRDKLFTLTAKAEQAKPPQLQATWQTLVHTMKVRSGGLSSSCGAQMQQQQHQRQNGSSEPRILPAVKRTCLLTL
jgi:hypothetical protein